MDNSTVLGLDVGYGNVKIIGRQAGSESLDTYVMPVGAAPLSRAPRTVSGKPDLRGGQAVIVDGEGWVAGIDPMALQGFARQTHEGYLDTPEYKALFLGALSKLGYPHINQLVTGLPCNHYFGPRRNEMRDALIRTFTGRHVLREGVEVTIDKVHVIAQPAGAFTALRVEEPTLSENPDLLCLVLDVGYYSVDYVLFYGDSMRQNSSDSSLHASSHILSDAARMISEQYSIQVTASRLESAMRSGNGSLMVAGDQVPVLHHVQAAAVDAARVVIADLATALRSEGNTIDRVLLTGGGAAWFEGPAKAHFGAKRVIMSKEPVLANAKGYQILASKAAQMMKA